MITIIDYRARNIGPIQTIGGGSMDTFSPEVMEKATKLNL